MACGCGQKAKIRSAVAEHFRKSGGSTEVNVANVVQQIREKRLQKIEAMEKLQREKRRGGKVTFTV